MLTKNISKEQRILILQQPLHQQFILHYSNTNGGVVLIHKLVDADDSDFELLVVIGIVLANDGEKVELLPKLHQKDVDFRNKVLPGAKMNKNPDLRINGEYWEVECTSMGERQKNGELYKIKKPAVETTGTAQSAD
jgi:hypothetical protein